LRAEKGESVCALNPPQNRTLHKVFRIGGQTVAALAVEDRVFENGQLADVALYYFGQGDDGMVYYLGEDVDEYRNMAKKPGTRAAWLLGVHAYKPGLLMPTHPKVGEVSV